MWVFLAVPLAPPPLLLLLEPQAARMTAAATARTAELTPDGAG
jgi:hypothetical protein